MNEMKEDDIKLWIEELDNRRPGEPEKKNFWASKWEDITFEIGYWWDNSIIYPLRSFKKGVSNLIRYRELIWNDRWWDYSFFLRMLQFKLRDMEENWGKNTHYVNDLDEKETLKKLLEDLDWMINDENEFSKGYEEEYKKRSKRFFGRLDRNHRKFWD